MNLKTIALGTTMLLGGIGGTVAVANTVKANKPQTEATQNTYTLSAEDYSKYIKPQMAPSKTINSDSIHSKYANAVETFINQFNSSQKVEVLDKTKEKVNYIQNSKEDIDSSCVKIENFLNKSTEGNMYDAVEQISKNDYTKEVFIKELNDAFENIHLGGLLDPTKELVAEDEDVDIEEIVSIINPLYSNNNTDDAYKLIKTAFENTAEKLVDTSNSIDELGKDNAVLEQLIDFYSINAEFSNNLLSPELFRGCTRTFQNITKETFNKNVDVKNAEIIAADVKDVKSDKQGIKTRKIMTDKGIVIEKTDAKGNTKTFDISGKEIDN